jgi:ABC-2 type transport system permease protein
MGKEPKILSELRFLLALWKTNLLSVMEYRAAFISQVLGMMLNNAVYFIFWVLFFERFRQVRGWVLSDMFMLFGLVAAGTGLASFLFGNTLSLVDEITGGRLDYYLSLPRPVLLHAVASKSQMSSLGDFLYGILSFIVAGQLSLDTILRFVLGVLISGTVFLGFLIFVQSLAFWMGNSQLLADQAFNAIITFSIYPITLFEGGARFLLFTMIPAAFVGAIPAEFVRGFSWTLLAEMLLSAFGLLGLAIFTFYRGLRRYESGSAINTRV